jgi:hypothetical protein
VTKVIIDAKKPIHLESLLSTMMTSVQQALNSEKLEMPLKNSKAFEDEASRSISITHAEIKKNIGSNDGAAEQKDRVRVIPQSA